MFNLPSLSACLLVWVGAALGHRAHDQSCRCVPDQWQGILASVDREFDLRGGHSGKHENSLYVHYDFANKRFAMTDLKTGSKAIADYQKGYKYVVRSGACHGMPTNEKMKQMCLPEGAKYVGGFTIGPDIPVDIWEFMGPHNVTMTTKVLKQHCMPVSEEVYADRGGYVSLTSSTYLDITLDIENPSVFDPPINCLMEEIEGHDPALEGENDVAQKRSGSSETAWPLLNMMQHGDMKLP